MAENKGGFKKGKSGNPGGRPAAFGAAREWCQRLIADETYRETLWDRAIAGELAPATEAMIWHYAIGKPTEVVEVHQVLQSVPDDVFKAEVERRLALMGGAADTANPDVRGGATEH